MPGFPGRINWRPERMYHHPSVVILHEENLPPDAFGTALRLRVGPATLLVFLSTAAGAGIIPSREGVRFRSLSRPSKHPHDIRWRTALPEFRSHEPHVRVDVFKEELISCTQIIQAPLTVGRSRESVLGAFPVAGEAYLALPAVSRQAVALIQAEAALLLGADQGGE